MTKLYKWVTGIALVGTALAPTIASANTLSVGANTKHAAVVALGSDTEVRSGIGAKAEASLFARLEALQRLMAREFAEIRSEIRSAVKANAEGRGNATTTVKIPPTATSTITVKARGRIVADVQHLIGDYRQTVHAAEVQYDKTVSKARVELRSDLLAALEAKDKEGAFAAFDVYMKTEAEADVKLDAVRASARSEFMADLKALFDNLASR